jgi:hypothetical protein
MLLDTIHKSGVNIGLLTSRSSESLGDIFTLLKPFINKNHALSSANTIVEQQDRDIMDESIPIPKNINQSFSSGDYPKIQVLNKHKSKPENNNKIFIPVDDYIHPVTSKYGVWLKNIDE